MTDRRNLAREACLRRPKDREEEIGGDRDGSRELRTDGEQETWAAAGGFPGTRSWAGASGTGGNLLVCSLEGAKAQTPRCWTRGKAV